MRLPRMARRLMVLAAISTTVLAGASGQAQSGGEAQKTAAVPVDEEARVAVSSLLHQARGAADDEGPKDAFLWTAASVLARAGHADEALRLADGDREKELKESIIRATAIAQARSGDSAGALRSAHLLGAAESRHSVIVYLAGRQALVGDVLGARRMVEAELAGQPEFLYALRMIAQVLEQKGNFAEAARTYEAIPGLKEKARGCRPVALARLKEGDVAGALKAADEARRLSIDYLAQELRTGGQGSSIPDIEPDSFRDLILWNIALEQARRGDASGVRKMVGEIAQPYVGALVAAKAAAILARAGDRPSAKMLIESASRLAETAGYRGYELMEIATAENLAGETEAARKTFVRALGTVGPVINQSFIPDAQAGAGDLEGALRTLEAISDAEAKERALRLIAKGLAKAGDSRKAVEIAGGIPSAGERVFALQEVSEVQFDAGDRTGALTTIRLAAAIDVAPESEALRAFAGTLSRLSDAREATAWVDDRSTPATRSWGLLGVAEGLLPLVDDPGMQLADP